MNEGLLEAESAVFSIGFCKPAVKKKMKIHFSPELCEKKSNVQKKLQDHCNRGTNSWETSALTSAHMVLCLESEKNTFKKRDELSKLTENSWTCCCLVTEMRSSAQGVLSFTMMVQLNVS